MFEDTCGSASFFGYKLYYSDSYTFRTIWLYVFCSNTIVFTATVYYYLIILIYYISIISLLRFISISYIYLFHYYGLLYIFFAFVQFLLHHYRYHCFCFCFVKLCVYKYNFIVQQQKIKLIFTWTDVFIIFHAYLNKFI